MSTHNVNFWKTRTLAIPGNPQRSSVCTRFQNFQKSISDAWDVNDEELYQVNATVSPGENEINRCRFSVNEITIREKVLPFQLRLWHDLNGSFALRKPKRCSRNQPLVHCNVASADAKCSETFGTAAKFNAVLEKIPLNLDELRRLSWSGVPGIVRPNVWRLLAGYLPLNLERRQDTLSRKRNDYWNLVGQYYDTMDTDETYIDTYRQIHIDVPRMSPLIAQQKEVQEMFERILFIWSIRHPASGYVQGINDLVTPFFFVFLQEVLKNEDPEGLDVGVLTKDQLECIEADSFWCISKFLDGIQDNYVFAQLGIQQKVNRLKDLVERIDAELHQHLTENGVDYLQFSFRWMNNLLTRELPLACTIRLWDTYLAEPNFAVLHEYVCCAFLMHWRSRLLKERDFQGLMMMLQNLPAQNWKESDVGVLVAEAYRLMFTFQDAPSHLLAF